MRADERERVPTVEELIIEHIIGDGTVDALKLAERLHAALAEIARLTPRETYAAGLSVCLKMVLDQAGVPNEPSPEIDVRVKVLVEQRDAALARVAELESLVCIHSVPPPDLVAEIERLRAELADRTLACDQNAEQATKMYAELTRLRAVLREIARIRRLLGEEK